MKPFALLVLARGTELTNIFSILSLQSGVFPSSAWRRKVRPVCLCASILFGPRADSAENIFLARMVIIPEPYFVQE